MALLGFFGFCIDEQYGEQRRWAFTEGAMTIEEFQKFIRHGRMAFNMQCWGTSWTIQNSERKSNKQHYISEVRQRRIYWQFAMTEADVGSDVQP